MTPSIDMSLPFSESGISELTAHDAPALVNQSAQRLIRVLEPPTGRDLDSAAELRVAVGDFVATLRTQGLGPEGVLVAVKDLLAEMGGTRDDDERRLLFQQVITWCIEEYYRPR